MTGLTIEELDSRAGIILHHAAQLPQRRRHPKPDRAPRNSLVTEWWWSKKRTGNQGPVRGAAGKVRTGCTIY